MLSVRECIEIEQDQIDQKIRDARREREQALDAHAQKFRTTVVTWSRRSGKATYLKEQKERHA